MRDNRNCVGAVPGALFTGPAGPASFTSPTTTPDMLLNELPNGAHATVERVVAASGEIDVAALRRLAELGFIPGEPVHLLRRGPGGREPLAVVIGETLFGLRLLEAQCIEVSPWVGDEAPAVAT